MSKGFVKNNNSLSILRDLKVMKIYTLITINRN